MEINLVETMGTATMKAYALHAQGRDVDATEACVKMRAAIKAGWPEFKEVLKDALDAHMGDAMYKQIMNTYANAWAVEAMNA
ncbi:MAG: hypothetical protein PHU54_09225 [Candidatus Omnitrophica bacterium]|jgi:hypothetical protein|nr:hypothetical protein [Candidatus Omnitrophota bacterium]